MTWVRGWLSATMGAPAPPAVGGLRARVAARDQGRTRGAAALAGVLLLAGCGTALPTPRGVHDVRTITGNAPADDPDLRKIPAGPAAGATAQQVVLGWLGATSDPTTAQRFLLPEAHWDPTVSTTVYTDQPLVNVKTTGDAGTATVTVTTVAEIRADGGIRAVSGSRTLSLSLRDADGEWRLSTVPDGVVVPSRELRIGRCPVDLAWLSADRTSTVPQDVLLPRCDPGDQLSEATAVVLALLAGPSERLGGTVQAALPAGATVAAPVKLRQSGSGATVVIDLAGGAATADPVALGLLRQQVLRSLPDSAGISSVSLLVDGQPPPTTGESSAPGPVLRDPANTVDDVTTLPIALPREAVSPDGRTLARLNPTSATTSVAQVGEVHGGEQPTWRPVGQPQAWERLTLSRDGTLWLVRGGQLWAVPPGGTQAQVVATPVPLTQLVPGRDGVHAVGVTATGGLVALLLHTGSAPQVLGDPADSGAGDDVTGASVVSAPEADGSVLVQGVHDHQTGVWRVETVLTSSHLSDATDDPLLQRLPDPCPTSTLGRLSTTPDRPDLAWCQDKAGNGSSRSLGVGAWRQVAGGGPQVYPGG